MTNNKSTFLYIRITDQETSSSNSDLQGKALGKWCTQNQIKDFQIFADHGASKLADERPAYDRMMEKLRNGECASLVVLSLKRIARAKAELLSTLEAVRANNVRFVSIEDEMDTRTTVNKT
jgi:site-specific DNA recombinase